MILIIFQLFFLVSTSEIINNNNNVKDGNQSLLSALGHKFVHIVSVDQVETINTPQIFSQKVFGQKLTVLHVMSCHVNVYMLSNVVLIVMVLFF